MRSNTKANPDDIDIVSLWGAVRSGLPRLLIFTLGAGALTFAVLSTIAPRYTSEAQIAIVAKGRVVREGTKDEMVGGPGGLEQAYLVATGAEADHVAAQ